MGHPNDNGKYIYKCSKIMAAITLKMKFFLPVAG